MLLKPVINHSRVIASSDEVVTSEEVRNYSQLGWRCLLKITKCSLCTWRDKSSSWAGASTVKGTTSLVPSHMQRHAWRGRLSLPSEDVTCKASEIPEHVKLAKSGILASGLQY